MFLANVGDHDGHLHVHADNPPQTPTQSPIPHVISLDDKVLHFIHNLYMGKRVCMWRELGC